MSYLVLARKWRPQVFEDVIGQRSVSKTLQNAISQNRVAHAYLFTGARGVGKTSTARILAKALNCEKGPQVNPCNQCKTCQEITDGNSIDVIEIDGASNRGIDEIRELRENVRYTPAKSRYKIYIIDEVHMLTREAFNALLKTLEEPPPHILFVFATTEPHKIPATILSRCQRYDFKKIPLRAIVDNLEHIVHEEKIQISQRGLFLIAQESEGSMRDAQSLLDQVISYSGNEVKDGDIQEVLGLIDHQVLSDTIEAIADRNAGKCMEMVDHIYDYGYNLQHFCRQLLQYLRNLILMKVSDHPEDLMELPEEEFGILRKQSERFQFDQLNHLFNLLLRGEEEVTQSMFPRVMLEMTLIRMATLQPVLSIDEILKKLESMEKGDPSIGTIPSAAVLPTARREPPAPSQKKSRAEALQRTVGETDEKEEPVRERVLPKASDKGEASDPEKRETKPDPPEAVERVNGESSEGAEENWKALVDFARARNPILGSFLALGALVRLDGERVEIGFEKDSFHYDRILEKENHRQLESICHDYFKKRIKVVISAVDQRGKGFARNAPESAGRTLQRQEEPSRSGEARNPIIQEALRLFDGRIVEE